MDDLKPIGQMSGLEPPEYDMLRQHPAIMALDVALTALRMLNSELKSYTNRSMVFNAALSIQDMMADVRSALANDEWFTAQPDETEYSPDLWFVDDQPNDISNDPTLAYEQQRAKWKPSWWNVSKSPLGALESALAQFEGMREYDLIPYFDERYDGLIAAISALTHATTATKYALSLVNDAAVQPACEADESADVWLDQGAPDLLSAEVDAAQDLWLDETTQSSTSCEPQLWPDSPTGTEQTYDDDDDGIENFDDEIGEDDEGNLLGPGDYDAWLEMQDDYVWGDDDDDDDEDDFDDEDDDFDDFDEDEFDDEDD